MTDQPEGYSYNNHHPDSARVERYTEDDTTEPLDELPDWLETLDRYQDTLSTESPLGPTIVYIIMLHYSTAETDTSALLSKVETHIEPLRPRDDVTLQLNINRRQAILVGGYEHPVFHEGRNIPICHANQHCIEQLMNNCEVWELSSRV
jgi:hypothetical protein